MSDENAASKHPTGTENPPFPPDPVIEAYKKDVDRTLIRENLKLTVQERLLKLVDFMRFTEELREAGRAARQRRSPGKAL